MQWTDGAGLEVEAGTRLTEARDVVSLIGRDRGPWLG